MTESNVRLKHLQLSQYVASWVVFVASVTVLLWALARWIWRML